MIIGEAVIKFSSNATATLNALKEVGNSATQAADKAEKASTKTKSAMDRFQKGAQNASASFKDAVTNFSLFSAGVLAAAGSAGVFGLKSAASFEQTRISMETMLGSVGAAKTMLQELSNFAKNTPFNLGNVTEEATKLLAYGISAKNIIPTLTALGNIASGVGMDKLPQLTLAFGQMTAKTKLSGEELRQFTEAGVPLISELARMTGKSTAEIQSSMDKGISIPAELATQALFSLSSQGGRFYNLMDKQSRSLMGIWSNIVDSTTSAMRSLVGVSETGSIRIGSAFDMLRQGATYFMNALSAINRLSPETQSRIISVAGAVVGTAGAFLGLVAAMRVVIMLSNPFMMVFSLIAAAVGVKIYNSLQKVQSGFKQTQETAGISLESVSKESGKASGTVGKMSSDTVKALKKIDEQMKETADGYTESLAEIVQNHQDSVEQIKGQISDEEEAYKESSDKEAKNYQKNLDKMEAAHQKKTKEILKNLEEEKAKDKLTDPARLKDLQEQLDEENLSYKDSKDEAVATYKEQTEDAKKEHDKKLKDLQDELKKELDFLKKHEADVASVKDVARRDEIEKLKADTDKKIAEYNREKQEAITEGSEKAAGLMGINSNLAANTATTANQMGQAMSDATAKISEQLAGVSTNFTNIGDSFSQFSSQFSGVKDQIINGLEAIIAIFVGVRATMLAQSAIMLTQGLQPLAAFIAATPWGITIAVAAIGIMEVSKQIQGLKSDLDGLNDSFNRGMELDNKILQQAKDAKAKGDTERYNRLMKIYGQSNSGGDTGLNWFQRLLLGVDHFATGVKNYRGGLALVGEEGPELVSLPRGSSVVPNSQIGNVSSTSNSSVVINQQNTFTRESDPLAFAKKISFEIARAR